MKTTIRLKLALLTSLLALAYSAQAQEPVVTIREIFNHAAGNERFSESSGHSIYEHNSWGVNLHSTFPIEGINDRVVQNFGRTQHISPSYEHLPEGINNKLKINGNSKSSNNIQHGYIIQDKKTGNILKYGVSGGPLNKNGSSPRANRQVNAIIRGGGNVEAKVINKNVLGRQKILNWERGKVRAYKTRVGHNPPRNTFPRIR